MPYLGNEVAPLVQALEGKELKLDSDGDSSITADTDDQIDFKTGGTDRLQIQSTAGNNVVIADGLTLTNGNIAFASGHGIDFSATADPANGTVSSELFDDYEEGTFTATMANSVTLNSSSDTLAYTKIGRQVTVTGQIQINNDNSNSHTVISNLPFTHFTQSPNEDADRSFCAVRVYNHDMADDAQYVGAFTAENTTNLYFVNVRDNASSTDLEADASGYLMFTITYFST